MADRNAERVEEQLERIAGALEAIAIEVGVFVRFITHPSPHKDIVKFGAKVDSPSNQ